MKATTLGLITIPPILTGALAYSGQTALGLIGGGIGGAGALVAWYVDSRASASGKYMRLKEILRRMSRGGEDVRIPPELADVRDYLLKLKPGLGGKTRRF